MEAYFLDKNYNKHRVLISTCNKNIEIISIDSYNSISGTAQLKIINDHKVYINMIYTTLKYRGSGIANSLLEVIFTIFNDCDYTLYGSFCPFSYVSDGVIDSSVLEKEATEFYVNHGFEFLKLKTYLDNKDKYPFICESDFKDSKKYYDNAIVYKTCHQNMKTKFRYIDYNLYDINLNQKKKVLK